MKKDLDSPGVKRRTIYLLHAQMVPEELGMETPIGRYCVELHAPWAQIDLAPEAPRSPRRAQCKRGVVIHNGELQPHWRGVYKVIPVQTNANYPRAIGT